MNMSNNTEKYKSLLDQIYKNNTQETPRKESPVSESTNSMENYLSALRGEVSFLPELKSDLHPNKTLKEETVVELKEQESIQTNFNEYVSRKEFDQFKKIQTLNTQKALSLGGGGEKEFRFLDDVDRSTMTPFNDNYLLEYDVASGMVKFTNELGPISHIHFDTNHTHEEERLVGTLCWDPEDQTLNLTHPGGVTQQIGQEQYAKVRNGTSETITNGTVVQFIGADNSNGTARLLVSPMQANGVYPSLYVLGIATQDIAPNEDGRVTSWGKVRDVNLSQFNIGDILYVSADSAGSLTNVKPTAPNNVIPVAAVLRNDSSGGELFVRPTIEQQMYYGRFTRLVNQTATNPNEASEIIFDTTEISNGISIVGSNPSRIQATVSGFYQFDISAQVSATSNKGVVYFWFRKNGIDIEHSSRSTTVTNGDTFNVSSTIALSLDASDYVEVMWARTAAGIILEARPATAFSPSTASVMLNVSQIQL